jgi:hypothetical protein
MERYLTYDVLRSGWINVLLAALTLALWIRGFVALFRHDARTTAGMVEVIWLVACLRACTNMAFTFYTISTAAASSTSVVLGLWNCGIASSMSFIDAGVLSSVLLLPVLFRSADRKNLQWHLMPGIFAGIGAVMVTHFTFVYALVQPPMP